MTGIFHRREAGDALPIGGDVAERGIQSQSVFDVNRVPQAPFKIESDRMHLLHLWRITRNYPIAHAGVVAVGGMSKES